VSVAADSDFLLGMAASSRARDEQARAVQSDAQQRSQLVCLGEPLSLILHEKSFDVIAEIKKRSPAEGPLDAGLASPAEQASDYITGGAAILSVLTEPERFDGSLDDLQSVAQTAVATPVMRKDFLVSRYQVREARLAGAAGVLLIAAILESDQMKAMLDAALELGMFVLMEAFDCADLDKCLPVLESYGPAVAEGGRCSYLLGINCRDLRTFEVDFGHFGRVAGELTTAKPRVAESGVSSVAQAETVARLGYRLALVGTALMRSGDPAAMVTDLRTAGSAACT
jgi:indole-3-glycerol phosphate synthase